MALVRSMSASTSVRASGSRSSGGRGARRLVAEYYDSLRLFSPGRYSGLPGLPFPGPPDRYPDRDEVVGKPPDSQPAFHQ